MRMDKMGPRIEIGESQSLLIEGRTGVESSYLTRLIITKLEPAGSQCLAPTRASAKQLPHCATIHHLAHKVFGDGRIPKSGARTKTII